MARWAGPVGPYGWFTQQYLRLADRVTELHLMPEGDLRTHEGPHCWCGPSLSEDAPGEFYTHHSLDRREVYEVNPGMRS